MFAASEHGETVGNGNVQPIETPAARPQAEKGESKKTLTPDDLVPALKLKTGQIIPGAKGVKHNDIFQAEISKGNADALDKEHGFVDKEGNFRSRQQAADAIGFKGELHSEDLMKLQTAPKPPAKVGKGIRRFKSIDKLRQEAGLPPDAIDFLQQEVGGKIRLSDAQKIDEGFTQKGRSLRSVYDEQGTIPLDKAAQALEGHGIQGDEDLHDKLKAAAAARDELWQKHVKNAPEPKSYGLQQHEDWEKQITSKGEAVSTDSLKVGDELDVDGERAKVTHVDEDGNVTVEDGRRFGTQILGPNRTIYVEKTYQSEPSTEFVPEEKPPLELASPESVEEQQARAKREAAQAEQKRLENERLERAEEGAGSARARDETAGGDLGSAGQGGLFEEPGQQEIFQPKPPGKPSSSDPNEPKIIGMGGATPSEFEISPKTPTGIKNATVDATRQRGFRLPSSLPEDHSVKFGTGQWLALIMTQMEDKLIKELREHPRALTDEEDAALLQRQTDFKTPTERRLATWR